MNATKQYQTLDERYGLSAVLDAMAVTAGEPDDEVILPQERLSRVMDRLRDDKSGLAEVAGGCQGGARSSRRASRLVGTVEDPAGTGAPIMREYPKIETLKFRDFA